MLADHQPRSLGELERDPRLKMSPASLMQCLTVLCGAGHLWPAQPDAQADAARSTADRLNRELLRRGRDNTDITQLGLLLGLGQRLVKEGRTIENAEETLAELVSQARLFAERDLPMLQALRIA